MIKLTTSLGAITLELDQAKAPISAENFVNYVQSGHYDGTILHRVIDGFMIQRGGFWPNGGSLLRYSCWRAVPRWRTALSR